MKDHTIDLVIIEAARLLKAAKTLRARRKQLRQVQRIDPQYPVTRTPVEAGALHRASMDLTRKLADLRQGR
jgi:hypothetical protein